MKLNKYFMLGLAGLAFAACSNEDEGNDILTKGTKQISVTISAGNYGQTKAGSGWTEDTDKAINPQNIKLYLLKADGNIVEVKDDEKNHSHYPVAASLYGVFYRMWKFF